MLRARPYVGKRVNGELGAIFVEAVAHRVAFDVGIDEHHVDERVDVVGVSLGRFVLVDGVAFVVDVGEAAQLFFLIVLEPFDAAFQDAGDERDVVLLGDLQAVDDGGGRVRRRLFAPAAEPAPAAVGELHFLQPVDAGLHDLRQLGLVEDGIRVVSLPAFGAVGGVADFLGVEVRALLLNRFEVELHPQQRLLRDDGRQEAVERLLGAAVRIIDEVGQGVDHRAGERGRVADFEPRLIGAACLRHFDFERAEPIVVGGASRVKLSILSMPWT